MTDEGQLARTEKLTAIGQLVHGIAHELSTPLGVVISNLAVLEEYAAALAQVANVGQAAVERSERGDAPTEVAAALRASLHAADVAYVVQDLSQLTRESVASAQRMATIVRSLATFAHHTPEPLGPVNVETAVDTALTLAWNELKHRATVAKSFAATPPVHAQLSQLVQVFVHLLMNAVQSLSGGGDALITLRTRLEGDEAAVLIADNGRGIPPQHLPHVFQTFGGVMAVDSSRGRGTTVTVRLPLAPP